MKTLLRLAICEQILKTFEQKSCDPCLHFYNVDQFMITHQNIQTDDLNLPVLSYQIQILKRCEQKAVEKPSYLFFFCFSWFSTIFQAWLYNVRIPPYKIQCKRNSLDLQYLTYTLMTIWALFFQLIGTTWHLQYLYIQLNFFFKFNLIPNTNIQLAEQTIIIILTESPKSNFQPRLVLPWNIDLIVLRILLPKSALSEHYLHRQ